MTAVSFATMSNNEIRFETYRYYLESINTYLIQEYRRWQTFGHRCAKHTHRLQGMRSPDLPWIERFMKIAWNTEYLLNQGFDDTDLIRINNQWVPIQAYYALYSASEALTYVLDGEKANEHRKALKKATAYFVQSGLPPWNIAFHGARGRDRQGHKPDNLSPDISIPNNLQRRDIQPIQMIAKCLKAEHSHRINDLFYKKKGRYKYQFDPGHTGLLHFFYRLRIKSNYKDVDVFLTQASESDIRSFGTFFGNFCHWTLLYIEIIIARKCRKRVLLDLATKYLEKNSKARMLKQRMCFIKNNL